MILCVSAVVRVIPHSICGTVICSVRVENGTGGSSAGCISSWSQSIVRPSKRAGVPVFNRPNGSDNACKRSASMLDGASPMRPAATRSSPRWINPPKKVPVVRTTEAAAMGSPASVTMPTQRPFSTSRSPTGASIMVRLGSPSNIDWIACLYNARSACDRGPCTAGPRDLFNMRN